MDFLDAEGEEDAFPVVVIGEVEEDTAVLPDAIVSGEAAGVALVLVLKLVLSRL